MKEQAFVFGDGQPLVGVLTEPDARSAGGGRRSAAIFLNAGVIHRVGPSRLYVHLARGVAALGWTALRFDHSGVGDSPVRRDGLPFDESAQAEAREAMDWLQRTRQVDRFVLIGLCSGAVTAFETAVADRRVAGIVMINPQGFDDDPLWHAYVLHRAQMRHYWTRALFSPASWLRALRGRVDYRRFVNVFWSQFAGRSPANRVVSTVVTRVGANLKSLTDRGVQSLLVCSEGDYGIDYMNVLLGADVRRMRNPMLSVDILPGADHSLTLLDSQRRVVETVCRWADTRWQPASETACAAATPLDRAPRTGDLVGASAPTAS